MVLKPLRPFFFKLCRTAYRSFYAIGTKSTSYCQADVEMCTQGLPDVATEYVCDGSADEICLPGDGGFVSGPDLFPLIITAFFLLLRRVFLHSRLRFGTIWCGGFCSEAERDNLVNMKQSEIEYYLEWTGHQSRAWFPLQLIPKKEGNVLSSCGEISFFSASISSCSPFKMKPRYSSASSWRPWEKNRDH